jgi:hypothetical protein
MNDSLGAATRAHAPMFESLGYEFREINFSKPGAEAALNTSIREGGIEFAFSAMGGGADISTETDDGRTLNLWEAMQVPFLSLLGDTPAYFFDRHVALTPWHACLYFFPEHFALRKQLPNPPAFSGCIPPIPFDARTKREIDFQRKSHGRLLFLKNGNDPATLVASWREALPQSTFLFLAELSSDLSSSIESDVSCNIDEYVLSRFMDRGFDIRSSAPMRLLFAAQLDDYVRRFKSTLLGKLLMEFPIDIQGFNWSHVDFARGRATYREGGDYSASGEQIRGALALIDMSPNTQLAPHDRPMRAFGSYTLCITNRQRYFSEAFEEADAFSYTFDPDQIRSKVATLIAHPKRTVELGISVSERFREKHKPEDFAAYLIDAASHIRAAAGPRSPALQPYFVWPPQSLK